MKLFITDSPMLGMFQAAGTPPSGTAQQPFVDAGTAIGTPVATMGFGAREQADETRQAQQREANDAIADVNINDVFSREQAGTMTLMGKNFEANADRRNKIFDLLSEVHMANVSGK